MPKVNIPTQRRKLGRDHPLWWVSVEEAIGSLVKSGGHWSLVKSPVDEDTREGLLIGGHVLIVTVEIANELEVDGFGAWIDWEDESVYTDDWTDDYFGEVA